MDESKNNQAPDEERKDAIRYSFGCLLLIFIGITTVVISLIIMYVQSISTGSKEFMVQ